MENKVLNFLPVKEVTGKQVIRNQIIFILILAFMGWLLLALQHYNIGSLIITSVVLVPLSIIIPLTTKVTSKITLDLNNKTFTADYFNALGQSKTLTFNLYNSFISYTYATSRTGGYWQLRIYENIINNWFKVRASKNGYSKDQLDEIYAVLQPYKQNIVPANNSRIYIYSAVFTLLILAGFFLDIFYSFHQPRYLIYVGATSLVIGIICLVFLWFYIRPAKGKYGLSCLVTVVLVFFTAFILGQIKKIYIKDQLEKYGRTEYVRILDTYQTQGTNRYPAKHYAILAYSLNHITYGKSIDNEQGIYHIGDSVKIICSTVNPEIYIIVDHKTATHEPVRTHRKYQ